MRELIVTLIGLLAAAVTTASIFAAITGPPADFPPLVLLYFGFSFMPAVFFGGMLFVVLRSFDLVRWWSAALGGLALGIAFATMFFGQRGVDFLWSVGLCALSGAVSGLVFWGIWRTGMRQKSRRFKDASPRDVPSA